MLFPAALFTILAVQQAPKPVHHLARNTHTKAIEHAMPAGPKTEAELQKDLDAALSAAPFGSDRVTATIAGKEITIGGETHSAQRKGVATEEARKIAAKDGWTGVHVMNQVQVKLSRER